MTLHRITSITGTTALLIAGASLCADTTAHAEPSAPVAAKTIVLVHGAFADGSSWDKVIPALQTAGYNVVAVHEPLSSLADDVAATKRVIDAQPGPVLLVGHSYGGVVITEAGNSDKVSGLVYVAAFAPDAGESVQDLGAGKPAPEWTKKLIADPAGFLTLPGDVVSKDFAQDVSAADAKLITAKQGPIAAKAFGDKVKTPAWKTKPSWFVRAEADHMIDPAGQELMAKRAGSKLTSVKGASHVVMWSKPKDVIAVILAAASGKK
jgi:pimeloyl-ACP methyl ester carboxylesterase